MLNAVDYSRCRGYRICGKRQRGSKLLRKEQEKRAQMSSTPENIVKEFFTGFSGSCSRFVLLVLGPTNIILGVLCNSSQRVIVEEICV